MPTSFVSETEVEGRINGLGESFSGEEASFKAFEERYLAAYQIIFDSLAREAVVIESGEGGDEEISMSKWMEPSRVIGVVVSKREALKPSLIAAVRNALTQINDQFAVVLSTYPTQVYIFPDSDILIRNESRREDLHALGLA